jgi:Dolichyl-phosphate-mannose-protein mannosyltransferase
MHHIRTAKALFLLVYTIQYYAYAITMAVRRPMWTDEFFTLSLARLDGFEKIWSALLVGPDLNPPIFHYVASLLLKVVDPPSLAIRLPAIVSYWIMSMCVFILLSRRVGWICAAVGILFIQTTMAHNYAFEARPYAIVLAACAASLLFWQTATDSTRPTRWFVAMAISLAIAVSVFYYSVLIFVPLALGEAVRSWRNRRIAVFFWVALMAGLMPLLAYRPLMEHAREFAADFWAMPSYRETIRSFGDLLGQGIPIALAASIVLAIWRSMKIDPEFTFQTRLPLHEMTAAAILVSFPVVAFVFALVATGAYTPRYALPATIGFGVLFALFCRGIAGVESNVTCLLLALLAVGVLSLEWRELAPLQSAPEIATAAQLIPGHTHEGDGLRVVIADQHQYLHYSYYSEAALGARLVYLVGVEKNSENRHMEAFRSWPFRVPTTPNIEDVDTFLANRAPFLQFGLPNNLLVERLVAGGRRIGFLGMSARGQPVFLVE